MKAVIIKNKNGKPLFIAKVDEISELDFLKIRRECENNQKNESDLLDSKFDSLANKIATLISEIKVLKGED